MASHADVRMCFKNAVGEFASKDAEHVLGRVLDDFGNVFDIHPRVFVLDANVSNSQDMKALKHAISELKAEIIDVSCFLAKCIAYGWEELSLLFLHLSFLLESLFCSWESANLNCPRVSSGILRMAVT